MGAPKHVDCSLRFIENVFFPTSEADGALAEIIRAHCNGSIKVWQHVKRPYITQVDGKEVREMRDAAVCCGYYATKEWLNDENFPSWQQRGVHLSEEGIVLNLHHAPYCAGCLYNKVKIGGVEKK